MLCSDFNWQVDRISYFTRSTKQQRRKMKSKLLYPTVACALVLAATGRAEEAGSGHYIPGLVASFIDAFPAKPGGIAVLNLFTYYDGSASSNQQLPVGGLLTTGIDATIYADTLAGIYQTPWSVLGGGLAFGVALPYVSLEVQGQAQRIGPDGSPGPAFMTRDTADGIGDMTLVPLILGWTNLMPDLKLDTRFSIYAPTGDYEKGSLANAGKNYWTFEPGIMASWLSSKIGTEVSVYAGVDFNTINDATDYQSGTSLHFDATLAQHFPLAGGFIGIGANAFYYEQLSGDSGSGARLGDFESLTVGVGPVLSYATKLGPNKTTDLVAEVKWLPELDVDNRVKGDLIWFKLVVGF